MSQVRAPKPNIVVKAKEGVIAPYVLKGNSDSDVTPRFLSFEKSVVGHAILINVSTKKIYVTADWATFVFNLNDVDWVINKE